MNLTAVGSSSKGNHTTFVFVWLDCLRSIKASSFMRVSAFPYSLKLKTSPLPHFMYTPHCLSIHLSVETLGGFPLLATGIDVAMNVGKGTPGGGRPYHQTKATCAAGDMTLRCAHPFQLAWSLYWLEDIQQDPLFRIHRIHMQICV